MNPLDQRKRFKRVAEQIKNKIPLTVEQIEYIGKTFDQIGDGESADEVFSLKYKRGHSLANDMSLENLSFALHYVACATQPINEDGLGYTLEAAFVAASDILNRLNGSEKDRYTPEYIKKMWYKYPHLQSIYRRISDDDFPY